MKKLIIQWEVDQEVDLPDEVHQSVIVARDSGRIDEAADMLLSHAKAIRLVRHKKAIIAA
jgi:hypothetical protein